MHRRRFSYVFFVRLRVRTRWQIIKQRQRLDWDTVATLTGDIGTIKKSIQTLNNRINGLNSPKLNDELLTKLAIEKTKCKDLSNLFNGPTAVAFGEDAIMSARILSRFAKDNENLKLIGGIMDNEILDQAGVQNVANLPTLDEARANIIGILNASASKLVSILLARSEKMSSLPEENSETKPKE